MVDWDKQKKFHALAEKLKVALQSKCGSDFELHQGYNANRFDLRSKRPAVPHFELEFTNEEQLAVSVGDGAYVPPFTGIASCTHCIIRKPDGWDFDAERISEIACRLVDLGTWIFEQHQADKSASDKS